MSCKGSNFLRKNVWYSGTFSCGLISFTRLISLIGKKNYKAINLFVTSRGKPTNSRFTEPQEPHFHASIGMLPCLLMTEMIS